MSVEGGRFCRSPSRPQIRSVDFDYSSALWTQHCPHTASQYIVSTSSFGSQLTLEFYPHISEEIFELRSLCVDSIDVTFMCQHEDSMTDEFTNYNIQLKPTNDTTQVLRMKLPFPCTCIRLVVKPEPFKFACVFGVSMWSCQEAN